MAKVLVACEFSGVVRDAFTARGHDAWSCDLLPTEAPGNHHQGDAIEFANSQHWDLMIAHPPCTYLCRTSEQWLKKQPGRWQLMEKAAQFFNAFLDMNIPRIAVENPMPNSHAIKLISKTFAQSIQPNNFGDAATKKTCLWLKGLPPLMDSLTVEPEIVYSKKSGRAWGKWFWDSSMLQGEARRKFRSTTFPGIANAMADQWGSL
jgi:hypothetical protein